MFQPRFSGRFEVGELCRRNRVSKSKSDEICRVFLSPMRQVPACNIYVGEFVERDKGSASLSFFTQPRRSRYFVPCGYPVSPPHLPADAPIADVLQPLSVNLLPVHGKKTDKMITHHGKRLFRFWVAQKPLLADARLDWHVAAIAEPDIVFMRLHFRQRSPCLQYLHCFFSRFKSIQPIQLRNRRTIDSSI